MTMKKHVLFIHGAGEGAYAEDGKLAASLQKELGADYEVIYPKMPNADAPEYPLWKAEIEKATALDGSMIYAGHSLGASLLLKYLSEADVQNAAGIFLIATPYWDADDWEVDEYALQESFASTLPAGTPIHFYHSADDEWVPFSHLALYRAKLPQATFHEFDGRGHQFKDDLSEVAADIASLAG
jgi:uncharacterized protein